MSRTCKDGKLLISTFLVFVVLFLSLQIRIDVDKVKPQNDVFEVISLESVKETSEVDVVEELKEEVSRETTTREEPSTDVLVNKQNSNESYLLAKIAMCEAEGESLEAKVLVIFTVLNRVESKEFPNTIEEVIFQERNGVYQFSPVMPNGRWWTVEPNEECWEAVRIAQESDIDSSKGATYFEACQDENNWHSRNLEFLYEIDGIRFYK